MRLQSRTFFFRRIHRWLTRRGEKQDFIFPTISPLSLLFYWSPSLKMMTWLPSRSDISAPWVLRWLKRPIRDRHTRLHSGHWNCGPSSEGGTCRDACLIAICAALSRSSHNFWATFSTPLPPEKVSSALLNRAAQSHGLLPSSHAVLSVLADENDLMEPCHLTCCCLTKVRVTS